MGAIRIYAEQTLSDAIGKKAKRNESRGEAARRLLKEYLDEGTKLTDDVTGNVLARLYDVEHRLKKLERENDDPTTMSFPKLEVVKLKAALILVSDDDGEKLKQVIEDFLASGC
jgi:hypothetical protein